MRSPLFSLICTVCAAFFTFTGPTLLADSVGNGGESIDVGGAERVFDQVEFDEPMVPQAQGQAWTIVDEQLKLLEAKLPNTAQFLRQYYADGQVVWWFVKASLKPSLDGGATNVEVTVNKSQVALNTGNTVQIQKDIWLKLNDDGKANLMMHEMLCSAVGSGYLGNGSGIRKLSRYLLHPGLATFSALNIASFIQNVVYSKYAKYSPLYQVVASDIDDSQNIHRFKVTAVNSGAKEFLVTTVNPGPSVQGLQMTTLRPNPNYSNVTWRKDSRHISVTSATSGASSSIEPGELCQGFTYAGYGDWRLPVKYEITELMTLNFLEMKTYRGPVFVNAKDTSIFQSFDNETLSLTGYHFISGDGADLMDYSQWDRESQILSVENPAYFCVRGRAEPDFLKAFVVDNATGGFYMQLMSSVKPIASAVLTTGNYSYRLESTSSRYWASYLWLVVDGAWRQQPSATFNITFTDGTSVTRTLALEQRHL